MSQRFGIVAAHSKPEAQELSNAITSWLSERGHIVFQETDIHRNGSSAVDAIVVLGGDGLMMRMANVYPDIPLFGINFGKVGFLALVEQKDWEHALELFLDGKYDIEVSATLQAHTYRDGIEHGQGWAINDVVIRGGIRMIDVEVYIDGFYVNTYPGDGMIVSTPRGSTAYCMAAGGPILTSGVRGFAVVPISSHSPIRTPMITSEDALIELITTNDHSASLILDGQQMMNLQKDDLVKIRRGKHTFQLVRVGRWNFYDAIREKFNYQVRPNAIPTRLAQPDVPYKEDEV